MIKIGIISTGFGVSGQFASFKKIEGCQVRALCGRDLVKTQKLAAENNVLKAYDDYRELLEDSNLDLVSIAPPNHLHKEMFLTALKHDKHIILEKPDGLNSLEIKEMIQAAKSYPKLVMVDHPLRFNPVTVKIKDLIVRGNLGRITNLQVSAYTNYGSDAANPHRWMDTRAAGGGQVLLMGTHLIDLGRFLLGMPKMKEGSLVKQKIRDRKRAPSGEVLEVEVEEQIFVNMVFENGIEFSFFNTLYGFGYKNFEIRVLGSKGIVFYDDLGGLRASFANSQPLEKIEVVDDLGQIESGRSFVSKSFKYFADKLVHFLNGENLKLDYCTLDQALENMLYLEGLKIIS